MRLSRYFLPILRETPECFQQRRAASLQFTNRLH